MTDQTNITRKQSIDAAARFLRADLSLKAAKAAAEAARAELVATIREDEGRSVLIRTDIGDVSVIDKSKRQFNVDKLYGLVDEETFDSSGPTVVIEQPASSRIVTWLIDHPRLDWAITLLVGVPLGIWLTPKIPLGELAPSVRITPYVALGACNLAFVMISFTPLALLSTLDDSPGVSRLRRHGDMFRRQYLLGTLALLFAAGALVLLGVFDAAGQDADTARFVATLAVVLSTLKVIRLTALFWAVLAADGQR